MSHRLAFNRGIFGGDLAVRHDRDFGNPDDEHGIVVKIEDDFSVSDIGNGLIVRFACPQETGSGTLAVLLQADVSGDELVTKGKPSACRGCALDMHARRSAPQHPFNGAGQSRDLVGQFVPFGKRLGKARVDRAIRSDHGLYVYDGHAIRPSN